MWALKRAWRPNSELRDLRRGRRRRAVSSFRLQYEAVKKNDLGVNLDARSQCDHAYPFGVCQSPILKADCTDLLLNMK